MALPAWQLRDSRSLMRTRWLQLALEEARAAADADEPHVARAFEVVALTLRTDHVALPPKNGREVLKGRRELREEAIRLGRSGLNFREVAVHLGQPSGTVYSWFKKAGVGRNRDQWRADVVKR